MATMGNAMNQWCHVFHKMSKNKTSQLKQNWTCANYDIYLATCVICHEQYVGQWSSHRSNWNKPNCEIDKNNKDKVALSWCFPEFHNVNKPLMRFSAA